MLIRCGVFSELMQLSRLKFAVVLWILAALLTHAFLLWSTRDLIGKGYPDFTIYYTAGTIVRRGLGQQLYDSTRQFAVQTEFASEVKTRGGPLPFNHPPFEALLFVPLSCISYRAAYWLWWLTNVAILTILPVSLRRHIPLLSTMPAPIWTFASFAFFPIFLALLQGQDTILLTLVYALAFISLRRGRFISAGGWLACGLFKFHVVLPFLALLLTWERSSGPRKRILYGFFSVTALLGVISIALVGVRQLMFYPHYVLALEATKAGGAIQVSDMPNLRGLLGLLFPLWTHLPWLTISLSAILFLIAAWSARSVESDPQGLVFSLLLLATVLISYHALGHDLSILFVPLLLVAQWLQTSRSEAGWARFAILIGAIVVLFSPLDVVLLMRYNRFAWITLAELACLAGLAREVKSRSPQLATQMGS
jgi:hypothetical protein